MRPREACVNQEDVIRWLFYETWWTWNRSPNDPQLVHDWACHYFNLVEAFAWFVFAVLVFRRWTQHHKSQVELIYALAFVAFGLSDVIEAWRLTSWLLWWKAINLTALIALRKSVIQNFYPDQRLF